MRLDWVRIEEFKNLRALEVDFDEESPYTVLVGENGSGKSNLIEALTAIFAHLDLGEPAPFAYQLRYECRANRVEVRAPEAGAFPTFLVRRPGSEQAVPLARAEYLAEDDEDRPLYRPAFVFGYYSGPSDRLANLFRRHRERYYRAIIRADAPGKGSRRANALRRLFYAQTLHGQFALLAFYMQPPDARDAADSEDLAFLQRHLRIEALDSVLFALKRPPWKRTGGDPRFWHAEGIVREFLGRLYDAALLPVRMSRGMPVEQGKRPELENLYLFLPTPDALQGVYASYPDRYAFFTALESAEISELLAEVRTRVRTTPAGGGGTVTYRDLSEGEQQLLLVLGLLKFTAEDETLFLLDEPDTHLNPAWSAQYLDFVGHFLRHRASCHIVMATHDPLVFSRLRAAQIRVLSRAPDGRAAVSEPTYDPRGLGVDAILTSDMFGLRTTLDPITQRRLDKWHDLVEQDAPLTAAQSAFLKRLGSRLHRLRLLQGARDPEYALFLRSKARRSRPAWARQPVLTPEQARARDDDAARLVGDLEARTGDGVADTPAARDAAAHIAGYAGGDGDAVH